MLIISSSAPSLLQFPSIRSSQRNRDLIPTNRRDFLALVSIATTTLLVFSADPQNASALSNRERETKMRARKNSNKNNRPLSPTAKDRRSSEQRSPRASAVSTAESEFSLAEPRSFPYSVKQQCWEKAEKVKGRDPDRWRRDSLGNTIFRKLVGCSGCLCHDYDHIVPYSKGGPSTLENCQVLQATVNRSKGNRTEYSRAELIQKSSYCRVSGRDMDLLELSAYGNVRRTQDSGGCKIQ